MYMMMMLLSQLYQEGLLRVILDGGPSRVFFPGDSKLLEEDVEVLKVIPQLSCKNSLAIHLMLWLVKVTGYNFYLKIIYIYVYIQPCSNSLAMKNS